MQVPITFLVGAGPLATAMFGGGYLAYREQSVRLAEVALRETILKEKLKQVSQAAQAPVAVTKGGCSAFMEDLIPTVKDVASRSAGIVTGPLMNILWRQRTNLEKCLLVGAVSYFGYRVFSKYREEFMEEVGHFSLRDLFKRGDARVEVVLSKEAQAGASVIFESKRAGSDEFPLTTPKSQALVGYFEGKEFKAIGSCVRMEGGILVGPDHVLSDGPDGSPEKFVKGTQSHVSIRNKHREMLDTDLCCISMTDKEFSIIGISVLKLDSVSAKGDFVAIVGPVGKGTTGVLKNDLRNFGRVIYEGTTVHGYSGAPYVKGPFVLGIHQRGGTVNGGFSAHYVWMLVKGYLKIRDEAIYGTPKFLREQFEHGKTIRWQNSYDPDYVQIYCDGKYSQVQRSSMFEAFGNEWEQDNEYSRKYSREYHDNPDYYESVPAQTVSGEEKAAEPCLGASCQQAVQGHLAQQYTQSIIAGYQKLSKKQRATFQKSLNLSSKQNLTSSILESAGPSTN